MPCHITTQVCGYLGALQTGEIIIDHDPSLTAHVANLPLHCESALAGALDPIKPIEEPQGRRNRQVKDDFADRDLPRLNLPTAFTKHAFRLTGLWCGRRGTVRGARLIELSGRFHGETSLVTLEGDE